MQKYVVANLVGGLGNQLFIYATAFALAERCGRLLLLNQSYYHDCAEAEHERYRLDAFRISGQLLPARSILGLWSDNRARYVRGIARRFVSSLGVATLVDRLNGYQGPLVCGEELATVLQGVWQCEDYFKDYRQAICEQFVLRDVPSHVSPELLQILSEGETVCVHLRRGDTVLVEKWRNSICCLGVDYYRKAAGEVCARVKWPKFVVFSDDALAARQVMEEATSLPVLYASDYQIGDDLADLYAMQHCRHFVLANSTFSWWAAWLAQQKGTVVVSPDVHSPSLPGLGEGRVCQAWIIVKAEPAVAEMGRSCGR